MRPKTTGHKRFDHPLVGPLTLTYQSFDVSGTRGQSLIVYHAPTGTADAQALALLETLAADTPHHGRHDPLIRATSTEPQTG